MEGTIPEDLLNLQVNEDRNPFPDTMRDDILATTYEIDIDVLPPAPEARVEAVEPRPVEERWVEEPNEEQGVQEAAPMLPAQDQNENAEVPQNGKSSTNGLINES